jgi:hypothetical protein
VWRLLATSEASLGRPAPNAQVEVIIVCVTTRRLMKHPGGPNHRLRRTLMAGRISEEARLELVRAEQPLHPRLIVHDQGAHEVPIPRFVETENSIAQRREAKTVEAKPAITVAGQASGVSREKQQICVTPGAVGAMPGMCASVRGRQVTDTKRVAPRKSLGYLPGRTLDRTHQGGGSESSSLSGTQPPIAGAPICQANRLMEISVIGGANRDGLPRRQRLRHAGTDRHDCDCGENPNHSKCMIAHGSA